MQIDVAKNISNKKTTGVLLRCKICGRYYTWNTPTKNVYVDVRKNKKRLIYEPEHCGSSVCQDFWNYYLNIRKKEMVDVEYAKHLYLKRKGIM